MANENNSLRHIPATRECLGSAMLEESNRQGRGVHTSEISRPGWNESLERYIFILTGNDESTASLRSYPSRWRESVVRNGRRKNRGSMRFSSTSAGSGLLRLLIILSRPTLTPFLLSIMEKWRRTRLIFING